MNIVKVMKLVKGDVTGVIRNDGNRGILIDLIPKTNTLLLKMWFCGRTSRSVNISFQQPDSRLRDESTPRANHPEKTKPPSGADFSILPSGYYSEI